MLSDTFAPITRRKSSENPRIWFRPCISLLNERQRSLKTSKITENHYLGEAFDPLKVAATTGISIGMLSTDIELNGLGWNFTIGSCMWAVAGLEVGDFAEISRFELF